ncbi:MAG: dihydrolipoyl dehydrogenase family protein, partial [Spirochaetota bacterium]
MSEKGARKRSGSYMFDVIVVGAGAAGLVAAVHAKGLNKRVLLVDRSGESGASRYVHDVQLKCLLKYAEDLERARIIEPFGVRTPARIQTGPLLSAVRSKRERVSRFSSFNELTRTGIETKKGKALLVNAHTVAVGSSEYTGRSIIVSTGSVPLVPDIPGLSGSGFLTPESLFTLESLPKSICIIGGGPAGCQFAAALSVFGCKVILLEREEQILSREDSECSVMAGKMLESRGVMLVRSADVTSVEHEEGRSIVHFSSGVKKSKVTVETILLCCGRRPAVESLNLGAAGIAYDDSGITVNSSLQSSVPSIYACGDITGPYFLTSRAEMQGAVAAVNAATGRKQSVMYRDPVWSLSLLPDLSRFGMTEAEARARYGNHSTRVYKFPYKFSMHSVVRDSTEGYAKIICTRNGRIVGAHVFGENSAEIVTRLHQARHNRISFAKLGFLQQIFPSYADVVSKPSLRAYVEQKSASFVGGILGVLLPH